MKKMIFAAMILLLLTARPAISVEKHHAAGAAPEASEQIDSMEQGMMDPAMLQQFNERMDKMRQISKQLMNTKKGEERQKLMREHMNLMQANMQMMSGMMQGQQGTMMGQPMMQRMQMMQQMMEL